MTSWRAVENSNYEVSLDGFIRNASTKRPLKLTRNRGGYLQCRIAIGGVKRTLEIHRLVADAFIDNIFGLEQVNRINEDKTDNKVLNLEWCSRSYNVKHSIHRRVVPKNKNFLTTTQRINIQHIGDTTPTMLLSKLYGVDRRTISRIRNRKIMFYYEPVPAPTPGVGSY